VKGRKAETDFVYERLQEMEASVTKGEVLACARGLNIGSKEVLLVPRVNGLTSERLQG
jgi:hypothetical protein